MPVSKELVFLYEKSLPVKVFYANAGENQADGGHWHDEFEIVYLKEGRANPRVNGRVFSMNAGDLILINSGGSAFLSFAEGNTLQGDGFAV